MIQSSLVNMEQLSHRQCLHFVEPQTILFLYYKVTEKYNFLVIKIFTKTVIDKSVVKCYQTKIFNPPCTKTCMIIIYGYSRQYD